MRRQISFLILPILFAPLASSQPKPLQDPQCSPGAICFSASVSAGEEFRHEFAPAQYLVLQPTSEGWDIAITTPGCQDLAAVVNPPYRYHNALDIDMTYGWTAREEVTYSPRDFKFVLNCQDQEVESQRLQIVTWPSGSTEEQAEEALASLGTSPQGKARLWITGFKISEDGTPGKIDWMKFTVEIKLPR